MSKLIDQESQVTLSFNLALEDGTVVDATEAQVPMTFRMGDGSLIEGLEYALLGLKAGDKQTLSIPPETGFGFPDPENHHWMPRDKFSAEVVPEVGEMVAFDLPDGEQTTGTVLEVNHEQVKIDFNHPLAGREVVFSVEILEVS